MSGEAGAQALLWRGEHPVDDPVVDVDHSETRLVLVGLLADDLAGRGTGAWQRAAAGNKKPDNHGEAVERSRGDARRGAHPQKVTR